MSWFDLGALLLTLLAAVDGATSGLAWAALETATLLGSAALACAFGPAAEPYVFKATALSEHDLPWVSHLVVFGLTAASLFGVLLLAHPAAKKWRFRHDAWAAGALGALNGVLVSLLLFAMLMGTADPSWEGEARTSRMVPMVAALAQSPVSGLLPRHAAVRAVELGDAR